MVKSPANLIEYYNKPEKTEEMIEDGWFHTEDLGEVDQYGTIYFYGKQGESFKVSGYTISPKEVEMVGSKHPQIEEIAILPTEDADGGTVPKAYIVKSSEAEITKSDLKDWFKENIAAYKKPEKIEFIEEMPKSTKGEILKRKLKEEE